MKAFVALVHRELIEHRGAFLLGPLLLVAILLGATILAFTVGRVDARFSGAMLTVAPLRIYEMGFLGFGIGWALYEGYAYDDRGRLMNANLLDYKMPTMLDVPAIETVLVEVPYPGHPYGIRGVGEAPIVAPPAQTVQCNSLIAARAFLLEGDYLMLSSTHQIHYDVRAGLLAALPHPGGVVTRSIGLTMRRNWQSTPAQSRLLDVLREVSSRDWRSHDAR